MSLEIRFREERLFYYKDQLISTFYTLQKYTKSENETSWEIHFQNIFLVKCFTQPKDYIKTITARVV